MSTKHMYANTSQTKENTQYINYDTQSNVVYIYLNLSKDYMSTTLFLSFELFTQLIDYIIQH